MTTSCNYQSLTYYLYAETTHATSTEGALPSGTGSVKTTIKHPLFYQQNYQANRLSQNLL